MHVLILGVEKPLRGCVSRSICADNRRTTLTRHQNHHAGGQPPSSSGYLSPFAGSTSILSASSSTSSLAQPTPGYPRYFSDPLGTSVQGLGIPSLAPPGGYGSAPPPSPFGQTQVGYTTRSSPGTSPQEQSQQVPRYHHPIPSFPKPPQFAPMQPPPRPYSTPVTSYPRRTQSEDSTVRIGSQEFSPPEPYDFRYPSERRQLQQQQQPLQRPPQQRPSPLSQSQQSFQSPTMPPPNPLSRPGHRRTSSQVESTEESEEERQRKRRRSGRGK